MQTNSSNSISTKTWKDLPNNTENTPSNTKIKYLTNSTSGRKWSLMFSSKHKTKSEKEFIDWLEQ